MSRIRRMQKGSAHTGRLARGCTLCEKGAKLVLLVTGKCSRRCYYCPLSSSKKGKHVFFANERGVRSLKEVLEEARLIDALGTGITGGDPLEALSRTVNSIETLKKEFGDAHQIHLYTSTTSTRRIDRVAEAGLDEIRFHPPVGIWSRIGRSGFDRAIRRSISNGMDTGIEIPAVPDRCTDIEAVVRYASDAGVGFVNLNELEFSETNWRRLRAHGFNVKNNISSGVAGSEEAALSELEADRGVPVHYCSSSFKDGVQLRKRIMRRARNVRRAHEVLTTDGTLIKGVVETRTPARTANMIRRVFGVPDRLLFLDREKKRLEVAPWVLEEIAPELTLKSYIVEEYPTADRLEVERTPLRQR